MSAARPERPATFGALGPKPRNLSERYEEDARACAMAGGPLLGFPGSDAGESVREVLDSILPERQSRYGSFAVNARISQELKAVMRMAPRWIALEPFQKEALEMMAHKISRILAGDTRYLDSWDDLGGYAVKAAQELREAAEAGKGGAA